MSVLFHLASDVYFNIYTAEAVGKSIYEQAFFKLTVLITNVKNKYEIFLVSFPTVDFAVHFILPLLRKFTEP